MTRLLGTPLKLISSMGKETGQMARKNSGIDCVVQGGQERWRFMPTATDAQRSSRRLQLGRKKPMRRRAIASFASAAALVLLVVVPAVASAAPSLEFTEVTHEPSTVNRGDEYVAYMVKVKNVGDAATTASVNVALDLPPGAKFANGEGTGWTCHGAASICVSNQTVLSGEEFPLLEMQVWIYPDEAPDTFTATFIAFGGGASSDAFAQDSFSFGPAIRFGLTSFMVKAEDEVGQDYT